MVGSRQIALVLLGVNDYVDKIASNTNATGRKGLYHLCNYFRPVALVDRAKDARHPETTPDTGLRTTDSESYLSRRAGQLLIECCAVCFAINAWRDARAAAEEINERA